MAFNLPKVLKALLFASNGPLTVKDIQDTLLRFHQLEAELRLQKTQEAAESTSENSTPQTSEPAPTPSAEAAEIISEVAGFETDNELYSDVPSLITTSQIREAMDAIRDELRTHDEVFFLVEGSQGYRLATNPKLARWVRLLRGEPPPVRLSQAALETLAVVAYRQPVTRGEIETIRGVSAEAGINKLLDRGLIYVAGRAELPGRPIQYATSEEFLEFVGVRSLDELPASDVLSNRQIDEWLQQDQMPKQMSDGDVGLDSPELPLEQTSEPASSENTSETNSTPATSDAAQENR